MKLALVMGTRPEILKVAPVIKELENRQIKHKVYFTSQHFTASMGKNFFKEFGLKISDTYKEEFTREGVDDWLKIKFKEYQPDCVLVQGDTKSAMLGALAASFLQIPVGHIEAGLRSFDFKEPFPEELYRTIIDSIATYMFCPTKNNKDNLNPRKHKGQKAFVTGNTIIDLIASAKKYNGDSKQVLVTMHRRENWERVKEICLGIDCLAENFENYNFVWVKHANKTLADNIKRMLLCSRIKLVSPQPYLEFVTLMAKSKLIITDSGGLVEEASALGIPVVIIRETTERQEAIDNGCAILAGTSGGKILDVASKILRDEAKWARMSKSICPFGNGKAANHIINILEKELK